MIPSIKFIVLVLILCSPLHAGELKNTVVAFDLDATILNAGFGAYLQSIEVQEAGDLSDLQWQEAIGKGAFRPGLVELLSFLHEKGATTIIYTAAGPIWYVPIVIKLEKYLKQQMDRTDTVFTSVYQSVSPVHKDLNYVFSLAQKKYASKGLARIFMIEDNPAVFDLSDNRVLLCPPYITADDKFFSRLTERISEYGIEDTWIKEPVKFAPAAAAAGGPRVSRATREEPDAQQKRYQAMLASINSAPAP